MMGKYKIKCKLCGDILEADIPLNKWIKCQCGNIGIYSDYIAFGMKKNLPAKECYEDLDKEKLTVEEVEKELNRLEKE